MEDTELIIILIVMLKNSKLKIPGSLRPGILLFNYIDLVRTIIVKGFLVRAIIVKLFLLLKTSPVRAIIVKPKFWIPYFTVIPVRVINVNLQFEKKPCL